MKGELVPFLESYENKVQDERTEYTTTRRKIKIYVNSEVSLIIIKNFI